MAVSLQDVLMRRLRLGILHHRQCLDAAGRVAQLMAQGLGWDESRTQMEVASLESELKGYMDVIGLEPSHIGVG
jgi:glycerol-3-phosphate dehydrogenase